MKKLKRKYRQFALIVFAVLIVLMVVGSFWDLPISRFLYPGHETSFGQFFAAFGELPAFLCITSGGVLLYLIRGRLRRMFRTIAALGAACLVLGGSFLAVHEATDNVPALPTWVALLVTVFFALVCGFLLVLVTRSCSVKTVFRFLCTLIFCAVVTMLLVNIIKVPWGRARMRLIAGTGNETYFSPWWKAGKALRDKLVADGISSDEFRSFPSGHTSCAACCMLLILLPTLGKQFRGKETVYLIVGAVWTVLVAFTRIQMGAHFLTDVTMAALIASLVGTIGIKLFYFNGKFFRLLWNLLFEPAENVQEEGTER